MGAATVIVGDPVVDDGVEAQEATKTSKSANATEQSDRFIAFLLSSFFLTPGVNAVNWKCSRPPAGQ